MNRTARRCVLWWFVETPGSGMMCSDKPVGILSARLWRRPAWNASELSAHAGGSQPSAVIPSYVTTRSLVIIPSGTALGSIVTPW